MRRRDVLKALVAAPFLTSAAASAGPDAVAAKPLTTGSASRVRPGDPRWPSAAQWDVLRRQTGGRLIIVRSPLENCRDAPDGAACRELFKELKNPYAIGDQVGLTQTTGWVDAWTFQPSVYAVAAETTADVVAAVNFARKNNLRLVIKGGGHSYLGRSNAPDSLLIWPRRMNAVVMHDGYVAQGCAGQADPQPAVSVGPGAIWGHTYNEVTTKGGRYVQGGGCLTVGVAGLVLAGGFGSHSKQFSTAAANLLEAEVVTADGRVRIANTCTNPDLYWGLKGGGGSSLGVITRLTLRTYDLPNFFGGVFATIHALSDAAFRRLVSRLIAFYADNLFNPQWGEIITLRPGNQMDIRMAFQGLDQPQAEAIWRPFFDWVVAAIPDDSQRRGPAPLGSPLPQGLPARRPPPGRSPRRACRQRVLGGQSRGGRPFHLWLRVAVAPCHVVATRSAGRARRRAGDGEPAGPGRAAFPEGPRRRLRLRARRRPRHGDEPEDARRLRLGDHRRRGSARLSWPRRLCARSRRGPQVRR